MSTDGGKKRKMESAVHKVDVRRPTHLPSPPLSPKYPIRGRARSMAPPSFFDSGKYKFPKDPLSPPLHRRPKYPRESNEQDRKYGNDHHRPPPPPLRFDRGFYPIMIDEEIHKLPDTTYGVARIVYCGLVCTVVEDLDKPTRPILIENWQIGQLREEATELYVYYEAVKTWERKNLRIFFDATLVYILDDDETSRARHIGSRRLQLINQLRSQARNDGGARRLRRETDRRIEKYLRYPRREESQQRRHESAAVNRREVRENYQPHRRRRSPSPAGRSRYPRPETPPNRRRTTPVKEEKPRRRRKSPSPTPPVVAKKATSVKKDHRVESSSAKRRHHEEEMKDKPASKRRREESPPKKKKDDKKDIKKKPDDSGTDETS